MDTKTRRRLRILLLLIVLSSMLGYLKWGGGHEQFLFQLEAEVFSRIIRTPEEVMHPFVILPLLGQMALLYSAFWKPGSRLLVFSGIGMTGILLGMVLLIGLLSMDLAIVSSSVPYFLFVIFTIRTMPGNKERRARL